MTKIYDEQERFGQTAYCVLTAVLHNTPDSPMHKHVITLFSMHKHVITFESSSRYNAFFYIQRTFILRRKIYYLNSAVDTHLKCLNKFVYSISSAIWIQILVVLLCGSCVVVPLQRAGVRQHANS